MATKVANFEIEVEKAEDSLPGVDEASEVIADLDRIAIASLRNMPAPSYQVTVFGFVCLVVLEVGLILAVICPRVTQR